MHCGQNIAESPRSLTIHQKKQKKKLREDPLSTNHHLGRPADGCRTPQRIVPLRV